MLSSLERDKAKKIASLKKKKRAQILKKRKKQKRIQNKSLNHDKNENPLAQYLKEIDKIKLLSRDEELELTKRMAEGDKKAREKLIRSNLRFVVNVAKKYQHQGLPLSDLISEGNLGLLKAAERFDHTRGYHFISYAVWWIKQCILKALSEKTRIIRLPLNRASQLYQIEKLKREKVQGEKEDLSIEEIATNLKISEESANNILRAAKGHVSIEKPLFKDKRGRNLVYFLKNETSPKPEHKALYKSFREAISNVLNTLDLNEREVIRFRYGLDNYKTLSLKQIGERFNLTKERIRQIEKKAIKKITTTARKEKLRPFLMD